MECASFKFDYFQWKYSDTLLNYGEGGSPGACETREFDYLLCCCIFTLLHWSISLIRPFSMIRAGEETLEFARLEIILLHNGSIL